MLGPHYIRWIRDSPSLCISKIFLCHLRILPSLYSLSSNRSRVCQESPRDANQSCREPKNSALAVRSRRGGCVRPNRPIVRRKSITWLRGSELDFSQVSKTLQGFARSSEQPGRLAHDQHSEGPPDRYIQLSCSQGHGFYRRREKIRIKVIGRQSNSRTPIGAPLKLAYYLTS